MHKSELLIVFKDEFSIYLLLHLMVGNSLRLLSLKPLHYSTYVRSVAHALPNYASHMVHCGILSSARANERQLAALECVLALIWLLCHLRPLPSKVTAEQPCVPRGGASSQHQLWPLASAANVKRATSLAICRGEIPPALCKSDTFFSWRGVKAWMEQSSVSVFITSIIKSASQNAWSLFLAACLLADVLGVGSLEKPGQCCASSDYSDAPDGAVWCTLVISSTNNSMSVRALHFHRVFVHCSRLSVACGCVLQIVGYAELRLKLSQSWCAGQRVMDAWWYGNPIVIRR